MKCFMSTAFEYYIFVMKKWSDLYIQSFKKYFSFYIFPLKL